VGVGPQEKEASVGGEEEASAGGRGAWPPVEETRRRLLCFVRTWRTGGVDETVRLLLCFSVLTDACLYIAHPHLVPRSIIIVPYLRSEVVGNTFLSSNDRR
jgi:hypothetical protein